MKIKIRIARNGVILTLITILMPLGLHSQAHCPPQANSACAAGATSVSEVPSGAVDGTNGVFTLSNIPWPGASVHVFDNGIEEKSPSDYQVKGSNVVFSAGHIPAKGDVVNVFYFQSPNWPPTQGSSGPSNFQPAVQVPNGEIAISQELVHGAIEREIARVRSPLTRRIMASARRSDRTDTVIEHHREPRMGQARYLGAISMLERRLSLTRRGEEQERAEASYRDVSADGVEGLGDNDAPGPFNYLSSREDSELNELLRAPGDRTSRSRHISTDRGVPSAITMLVDRLSKDGK